MSELRQSPLHAEHEKLGASFTAFGPWTMPLKIRGKESTSVTRSKCQLACLTSIKVDGPMVLMPHRFCPTR